VNFLNKIFTRVLVVEFYRVNAGFFFIVIGVGFGFLSGKEHTALAHAFVGSTMLLFIPILIWAVYTLKVIQFNKIELSKDENSFLLASAALSPLQLLMCCLALSVKQLILPILYGGFLLVTALKLEVVRSLLLIIVSLSFLALVVTLIIRYEILHPGRNKLISLWKRKMDSLFVKPLIWFYPEWISRQQPLMVIGTKIFAGLLIVGVGRLYLFDSYDERLMAMGCTLSFSANLALVYFYHQFENFHFSLMRSLPIPLFKRLLSFLGTVLLLNLTEIGLLFNYYPSSLSPAHGFILFAFALSIYLLAFAVLYLKSIPLETFIQKVFIASFCWIILILFKIPVVLIAFIQILAAWFIYSNRYYSFEHISATKAETNN
jgi:hypothetical protein